MWHGVKLCSWLSFLWEFNGIKHICRCYDVEKKLEERERHPINAREMHTLTSVSILDILPPVIVDIL